MLIMANNVDGQDPMVSWVGTHAVELQYLLREFWRVDGYLEGGWDATDIERHNWMNEKYLLNDIPVAFQLLEDQTCAWPEDHQNELWGRNGGLADGLETIELWMMGTGAPRHAGLTKRLFEGIVVFRAYLKERDVTPRSTFNLLDAERCGEMRPYIKAITTPLEEMIDGLLHTFRS
jgi:hypothetical protein